MKYQDQRIHELERELVVLQLACRDVMQATQEGPGDVPELRRQFERLFEKRTAAKAEWLKLSGIRRNPCTDLN